MVRSPVRDLSLGSILPVLRLVLARGAGRIRGPPPGGHVLLHSGDCDDPVKIVRLMQCSLSRFPCTQDP